MAPIKHGCANTRLKIVRPTLHSSLLPRATLLRPPSYDVGALLLPLPQLPRPLPWQLTRSTGAPPPPEELSFPWEAERIKVAIDKASSSIARSHRCRGRRSSDDLLLPHPHATHTPTSEASRSPLCVLVINDNINYGLMFAIELSKRLVQARCFMNL